MNWFMQGIILAIKTVYPCAKHKYCLRHIHENIKQGLCRQAYKDLLWIAASATNVRDFEKWRAKSDLLLNNICKVFNGKIVGGGDNVEGTGSASMQEQQIELVVGQDGSSGSGATVVIGLFVAAGEGGAGDPGGASVSSQGLSHTRWIRRRVQTERISPQKRTPTQPASQPSTSSEVPVSQTRNADEREMGDGVSTQSSAAGGDLGGGGYLRDYVRIVAGTNDRDSDSDLLIPTLWSDESKNEKGQKDMPSEAVEQEMDATVPDEIDGANVKQVSNHVLKKECKCGIPLMRFTSWTRDNPTRRFGVCPNKYKKGIKHCKRWYWNDLELDNKWYKTQLYEMHLLLNASQREELENEITTREELAVLQVEFLDMKAQMQQLMKELKISARGQITFLADMSCRWTGFVLAERSPTGVSRGCLWAASGYIWLVHESPWLFVSSNLNHSMGGVATCPHLRLLGLGLVLFYFSFLKMITNTIDTVTSVLTQRELDLCCSTFNIPAELRMELPGREDIIKNDLAGKIGHAGDPKQFHWLRGRGEDLMALNGRLEFVMIEGTRLKQRDVTPYGLEPSTHCYI
nr:hypothetical protein [Tanacetum cinerariifolium]